MRANYEEATFPGGLWLPLRSFFHTLLPFYRDPGAFRALKGSDWQDLWEKGTDPWVGPQGRVPELLQQTAGTKQRRAKSQYAFFISDFSAWKRPRKINWVKLGEIVSIIFKIESYKNLECFEMPQSGSEKSEHKSPRATFWDHACFKLFSEKDKSPPRFKGFE